MGLIGPTVVYFSTEWSSTDDSLTRRMAEAGIVVQACMTEAFAAPERLSPTIAIVHVQARIDLDLVAQLCGQAVAAIVALTPAAESDLRIEALEIGADDAVDRGITGRELLARIRRLKRSSKPYR